MDDGIHFYWMDVNVNEDGLPIDETNYRLSTVDYRLLNTTTLSNLETSNLSLSICHKVHNPYWIHQPVAFQTNSFVETICFSFHLFSPNLFCHYYNCSYFNYTN